MAWLFERTIELAAWVAFILGLVLLGDSVFQLYLWIRSILDESRDVALLRNAGQSAAGFVLSALVMGALACIDRYVFDLPEPLKK
jgi:hypothetical protein